MPPPAPSSTADARPIYIGTLVALLVVASLSVLIYQSMVRGAIQQHSAQQLAMVRTAAIGLEGELRGLTALLRQFNSLPSVQNLDIPFLGTRIAASFDTNPGATVRYIVRIDAGRQLYSWAPSGELRQRGLAVDEDAEQWAWFSNVANRGRTRIIRAWPGVNSEPRYQALAMPVWRTAPSAEILKPSNDFNGVIAFVVDLDQLVERYMGPALSELAADGLVAGLATRDYGVRIGPGTASAMPGSPDQHNHTEAQGTSILDDQSGRRIHAWAQLPVADETWLVASSAQYRLVASQIQRSATGQLALIGALLVGVPLVGWLLARRERRAHEGRRLLERQFAESQKMEAIGRLAGGVAHDFNNMLTAILGYASLLSEDAPPGSPVRDQANQIRRAAENAAALTHKLLAFSRRQVLQTNQFDFTVMLDGLVLLVRRVIGEHITVTADAEAGLWPVLADPAQVEQSIVNLAINARDAMPEGGRLTIVARNAPRPNGEQRPEGDVRPGSYVQITVTDTGTGMDEATRARMFEPFFTTKAPGKGTGLGLSMVYGFIQQCGGHISVTTAPGRGTTVELMLPRATEAATPTPTPTPSSPPPTGAHETILVVEDEDAVRLLAVESLSRAGYQVLAAASGEDALRVADGFDGTIDALLTDVVMPGMKGPELARRLRAARPSIRVLLMSGYAADVVTKDDLKEARLLSKPFASGTLTKELRKVLDQPLSPGSLPKG